MKKKGFIAWIFAWRSLLTHSKPKQMEDKVFSWKKEALSASSKHVEQLQWHKLIKGVRACLEPFYYIS
jgi:hypothetical protein